MKEHGIVIEMHNYVEKLLFKYNKHEKLTFNWLGLEVHRGHALAHLY
jgi:hypothetical protein